MTATSARNAVHPRTGAAAAVPGPPSPMAVRLSRPGWRDPRLLLGLVLVAAAVALGSAAVSAAGRTVPVLATTVALVPGQTIDRDSLVVEDVRLGAAEDLYLVAGAAALDEQLVVVRTVGPGEVIPLAAVAPAAALELRSVAVTPSGTLSEEVVRGASVDLWFVPANDRGSGTGEDQPAVSPRQLAAGLVVAEVSRSNGALAVGGATAVHVLVPTDRLPDVLAALAADGTVAVVPVAGSAP